MLSMVKRGGNLRERSVVVEVEWFVSLCCGLVVYP